ncbi:PREDICTED: lipase 3-like, partial [Wasmannia auropunctata]|uniref:lipase 3-like n=1 Tax=Wasmannia auropunctata TaxID=64793 RepID=UPI0005EF71FF
QFSYHEMGTRDLPAMIDYVLNYTKQETLRYIGHSMGTTALFILLSMRPEYNAKIELGICLAPIAIWKEVYPSQVFKYVGNEDIKTLLPEMSLYIPGGCSMQTLHHYYQNIITEKFQAYDYGYVGNYKQYGQITPIMYDLTKITARLALFYGANDFFTSKS